MKIYSYVVARDFGFAPNPFFNYCTLATCKPSIRASAQVGDWVIGTGAKTKYDLADHLVYAMEVTEVLTFDEYWNDPRFKCKKPVLNGSLIQLYGDNIYHCRGGKWIQADSHHSREKGKPNLNNIRRDTTGDRNRVLISYEKFVYHGRSAIPVPNKFRPYKKAQKSLCQSGPGYRIICGDMAKEFLSWLESKDDWDVQGMPFELSIYEDE